MAPASARRLVPELLSDPVLLVPELCAELPPLSFELMSEQPASAAKPSAAAAVVTQNRVVMMFHLIAVASG